MHICSMLDILHFLFPILLQGDYVWVDSSTGVPIGAEVRISGTGQIQLIDDEGKVISPLVSSTHTMCQMFKNVCES